jgi:hypothetical protein
MNKETAISQAQLNMVNQNGPGGSSSYKQIGTYDDGTPRFEQNVSLSPSAQSLYDSQNNIQQSALNLGQGAIGHVQDAINKPFDTSNLPGQVFGVTPGQMGDAGNVQRSLPNTDYAANVKSVQDALMQRLNPQIEQDRTRLETRLANQGVTQGSDAYNRAINLGEQNVNDQRTQALLAASGEQSRLAGLDLQAGNFANGAQQQIFDQLMGRQAQEFGQGVTNANLNNAGRASGIQEAAYNRSQPINELAALMGFSPGVQIPNFQNTTATGIAAPDYQGAVAQKYAGDMNAWQSKVNAQQALMGQIFGTAGGLGSAAIFASDRRLKTNIRRIGAADNGLPLYTFHYKEGGPLQVGFMADEVEKVKPWAVVDRGGYKHVNYSLAVA